jgi:hypothetical protein
MDGGLTPPQQIERRRGFIKQVAACCQDRRQRSKTSFSVTELLMQRTFEICLGYEDLNDHGGATIRCLVWPADYDEYCFLSLYVFCGEHLPADSSICCDDFIIWCEEHEVEYILGLARNSRLVRELAC